MYRFKSVLTCASVCFLLSSGTCLFTKLNFVDADIQCKFIIFITAYADGYMMPAPSVVSASSNTSHVIQYAAPDKPGFIASLKSKGFRLNSRNQPNNIGGPEVNKRGSKPVHYKRSSNNTAAENSAESVQFPNGERDAAYDSIGELLSKVPQNRRPTLPENHPGRLSDWLNRQPNQPQVHGPKDTKSKIQPSAPPMPTPRQNSNSAESNPKADNYGYDQADNVARQPYKMPPPSRPVPRRQNNAAQNNSKQPTTISSPPNKPVPRKPPTDKTVNGVTSGAPKVPLKPPNRPVPRHNKQGVHNASFQADSKEVQI